MKQYFNENNELVNVPNLIAEINSDTEEVVTEIDLEGLLEQYYSEALTLDLRKYAVGVENFAFTVPGIASLHGIGAGIWARIRQFVCGVINDGSTLEEIVEAVLDAISKVIPGGWIIGWIVKKVVKFIIKQGVAWLCPVEPAV